MGVYDPLNQYPASSKEDVIKMTFSEIENLLGRPLPKSASKYSAWWENEGRLGYSSPNSHSHARAWLDAGYKVAKLDIGGMGVTFIRDNVTLPKNVPTQKRPISEDKQRASFVNT